MNALILIMNALPAIAAAIKAVEAAVPGRSQGPAKLDAVLQLLCAADAALAQCVPQLTNVVNTLVGLFNKVGAFTAVTPAP